MPRPVTRSLDEAPAPTLPVAQLHLAELRTPEVAPYQTVSSAISALPAGYATAGEEAAFAERGESGSAVFRRELYMLVRSPQALRSALLLREILGPPRGLQTAIKAHSFPAP